MKPQRLLPAAFMMNCKYAKTLIKMAGLGVRQKSWRYEAAIACEIPSDPPPAQMRIVSYIEPISFA